MSILLDTVKKILWIHFIFSKVSSSILNFYQSSSPSKSLFFSHRIINYLKDLRDNISVSNAGFNYFCCILTTFVQGSLSNQKIVPISNKKGYFFNLPVKSWFHTSRQNYDNWRFASSNYHQSFPYH